MDDAIDINYIINNGKHNNIIITSIYLLIFKNLCILITGLNDNYTPNSNDFINERIDKNSYINILANIKYVNQKSGKYIQI